MADLVVVGDWLKLLGTLTANNVAEAEALKRVAVYMPLLAREYGNDCFTENSLIYVGRRNRFFPEFAVLCEHLSQWWREQPRATATPVLSGPAYDPAAERRQEADQRQREWEDAASIERRLCELEGNPQRLWLGRMMGRLVVLHAPQHIHLLPAEFISAEAQQQFMDGLDHRLN